MLRLLLGLFFASGAVALASQVVLNRLLSYVFGATHLATSTVLAAYMCGLTVGAFLFGRLSRRLDRPIRTYAVLELIVGAYLASAPLLFTASRSLVLDWSRGVAGDPSALTAIRFALAFLFVLVPTTLMGGTLPVLLAGLVERPALTVRLPWLYAANTLGGAAGTLLSGYAAIPALGLDGTLYGCALVNAAIAAVGFSVSRTEERRGEGGARVPQASASAAAGATPSEWRDEPWPLPPLAVCLLAFGQGVLTFVLEVTWSHLIRTVIGVTVYAYSLMLAAVLLGIGLGSLWVPRVTRRLGSSRLVFAWALMTMSLSVGLSMLLWDRFPDYVWLTVWLGGEISFWSREVLRFLFVLVLLFPASLAMGLSLPALTASAREGSGGPRGAGAWTGLVFAANTLGAIFGALTCGFVLLGWVGSHTILLAAALLAAAMGVAAHPGLAEGRPWRQPVAWVASATALALLLLPGWDVSRLTAGAHYYWAWAPEADDASEILSMEEDAQVGFVSVVRSRKDGWKEMKTNGKYEGSDVPLEFQDNFALLAALYVRDFGAAAVVGLGPGRTLDMMAQMPFRRIDAFEFSHAVIRAAETHFPELVRWAREQPQRVRIICDDGRNHLQLHPARYDLVVTGITAAAFAGVGNLYSRDFFEVVRSRLRPGGVFLLWTQIHSVPPHAVRSVVYTMRQTFPHVHFYAQLNRARNQGFVLASDQPLVVNGEGVRVAGRIPRTRTILDSLGLEQVTDLTALAVFTTDQELERYFADTQIRPAPELLTDFNPAFEYAAPFGLAMRLWGYDFSRFGGGLPPFEPPLPEAEHARLLAMRRMPAPFVHPPGRVDQTATRDRTGASGPAPGGRR